MEPADFAGAAPSRPGRRPRGPRPQPRPGLFAPSPPLGAAPGWAAAKGTPAVAGRRLGTEPLGGGRTGRFFLPAGDHPFASGGPRFRSRIS
jgi:hypothetical protein